MVCLHEDEQIQLEVRKHSVEVPGYFHNIISEEEGHALMYAVSSQVDFPLSHSLDEKGIPELQSCGVRSP